MQAMILPQTPAESPSAATGSPTAAFNPALAAQFNALVDGLGLDLDSVAAGELGLVDGTALRRWVKGEYGAEDTAASEAGEKARDWVIGKSFIERQLGSSGGKDGAPGEG